MQVVAGELAGYSKGLIFILSDGLPFSVFLDPPPGVFNNKLRNPKS